MKTLYFDINDHYQAAGQDKAEASREGRGGEEGTGRPGEDETHAGTRDEGDQTEVSSPSHMFFINYYTVKPVWRDHSLGRPIPVSEM